MNIIKAPYLVLSFFIFAACSTPQKTLYSWGNYDAYSYAYVKNSTEENLDELLEVYQKMVDQPTGIRKTVPPGICADYGYLLIKKGKKEEGIKMLKNEIVFYPESVVFISRIIKQLEE